MTLLTSKLVKYHSPSSFHSTRPNPPSNRIPSTHRSKLPRPIARPITQTIRKKSIKESGRNSPATVSSKRATFSPPHTHARALLCERPRGIAIAFEIEKRRGPGGSGTRRKGFRLKQARYRSVVHGPETFPTAFPIAYTRYSRGQSAARFTDTRNRFPRRNRKLQLFTRPIRLSLSGAEKFLRAEGGWFRYVRWFLLTRR